MWAQAWDRESRRADDLAEALERAEAELDQANDALLAARTALGEDDRPFLDEAIGRLRTINGRLRRVLRVRLGKSP
jgi:hypothetical protein